MKGIAKDRKQKERKKMVKQNKDSKRLRENNKRTEIFTLVWNWDGVQLFGQIDRQKWKREEKMTRSWSVEQRETPFSIFSVEGLKQRRANEHETWQAISFPKWLDSFSLPGLSPLVSLFLLFSLLNPGIKKCKYLIPTPTQYYFT